MSGVWTGELDDPHVIERGRSRTVNLIRPLAPCGIMGEARPDLERFALAAREVGFWLALADMGGPT